MVLSMRRALGVFRTLGVLMMAHAPRPLPRRAMLGFPASTASAGVTAATLTDVHQFNARRARRITVHPEHMLLRRVGAGRCRESRDGCQHEQSRGWSYSHFLEVPVLDCTPSDAATHHRGRNSGTEMA
jgi:hypothetical protein